MMVGEMRACVHLAVMKHEERERKEKREKKKEKSKWKNGDGRGKQFKENRKKGEKGIGIEPEKLMREKIK